MKIKEVLKASNTISRSTKYSPIFISKVKIARKEKLKGQLKTVNPR